MIKSIKSLQPKGWLESGTAFFQPKNAHYSGDAAAAIIIETHLGTLTFGGVVGNRGNQRIFFAFGKIF